MMPQRHIIPAILGPLLALALLSPAPALAGEGGDKKPKGEYLAISGLAATVIRPEGGHGVMTVEAGLDTSDPILMAYADTVQPRIRDAFARVLQGYAGALPPGTPPDADYLARRLQEATNQVLGKPGVRLLLCGVMLN